MRTRQTVTVIGSGNTLIKPLINGLSEGNYRLLLCNKNLEESKALLSKIPDHSKKELEAIDCTFDGCWEADIIITAVNNGEERELAEKIKIVANQKLLINIRDGSIEQESLESYNIFKDLLPNSKLVQVAIKSSSGDNAGQPEVNIKGDDESVKDVIDLFSSAGIRLRTGQLA